MPIAVGDIIQTTVRCSLFGQQTITSWFYRVSLLGTSVNPVVVCDDLIDDMNVSNNLPLIAFQTMTSNDLLFETVTAQQLTATRSVLRSKTSTPPAGLRGGAKAPNIAAFVAKGTDLAGRDQMGGWHIPGIASDDIAGGLVQNALFILLGTFASKSLNNHTLSGTATQLQPVLFHYNPENPLLSTGSTLTRAVPYDTVRVQRRRTVGVGK